MIINMPLNVTAPYLAACISHLASEMCLKKDCGVRMFPIGPGKAVSVGNGLLIDTCQQEEFLETIIPA